MEGYANIWGRFKNERRLELGGHTDPEWQEGHAVSASLVAPVEAPHLREGLKPLRDALRPFPFVSLHPDHFMHLTLLPLGFLHLTLAYLQEADGTLVPDEFVAAIERYRDWPVGKVSVERVEITLLTLGSSPYPKLETFARIPLDG